jgi:hypothetical protein
VATLSPAPRRDRRNAAAHIGPSAAYDVDVTESLSKQSTNHRASFSTRSRLVMTSHTSFARAYTHMLTTPCAAYMTHVAASAPTPAASALARAASAAAVAAARAASDRAAAAAHARKRVQRARGDAEHTERQRRVRHTPRARDERHAQREPGVDERARGALISHAYRARERDGGRLVGGGVHG